MKKYFYRLFVVLGLMVSFGCDTNNIFGPSGSNSPDPPTGLTASVNGSTVLLSWKTEDNASGYMLYSGTSTGNYGDPIDLENVTSKEFANVPDNTYYVALASYNGNGEGNKSAEISLKVGASTPSGGSTIDLSRVVWLHSNVSGWAQTATLSSVSIGSTINLNYDKARSWPAKTVLGTSVNANPWIFVNKSGIWYAATFEWFRPGQTSKPVHVVNGNHIKVAPLNNFSPKSGKTYGFMVSGLARTNHRNVQERTNIVMKVWP